MDFNFTHPYYLFGIGILPVMVFLHFYLIKTKRNVAVQFSNFDALARIRGLDLYSKNLVMLLLTMLLIVLVILALAGLSIQRELNSSVFSYVIAIDTSQSMEATDLSPSRLEVVKEVAQSFVDRAPSGTSFAIISFSGNSYIEQTLSIDKIQIKEAIKTIDLSSIGGTDIYEAIVSSTNMLAVSNSKSIILMSDGQINVGNIQEGIDYAIKNNVAVNTIALGTEEGGLTKYGMSKVDTQSLQSIAYSTQGKFFRVKTKEDFSSSMDEILSYKIAQVSFDMTQYLLIAVIILIFLIYILSNTRYRMLP